MQLWRLSGAAHARAFDGGYGLLHPGRWNSLGRAVTYCATSPCLCVLEKLVHVEDPALLPELAMVRYDAPDDFPIQRIDLADLPQDWRQREALTQALGDGWHADGAAPVLQVPSAVVPLDRSPDLNLVLSHRHARAREVRIAEVVAFTLDVRLL